jgi:hypothetical protein
MKLFQIEEPQGGPADASLPGAAIGVDASGGAVEVAFSVGGNAVLLREREEFARNLPVPDLTATVAAWRALFEGVRLRAERALARPVSHAVVVLAAPAPPGPAETLHAAAAEAGIAILRLASAGEMSGGDALALAAALLAEDLLPRPGTDSPVPAYFS